MSRPDTVAAIDVGSNSIKLLVACLASGPGLIEVLSTKTIETRISAGISQKRSSLTKDAIKAGTETIVELLRLAHGFFPRNLQIVATSAVRDARNGNDFIDAVFNATGHTIRILSGEEEATLIGQGIAHDPGIDHSPEFIQMDIGGGSLELIRFSQGKIQKAISLQLGAVRLTESYVANRKNAIDTTTEATIREHVIKTLIESKFPFEPNQHPLIATGGAITVTRAVLAAKQDTTINRFRAKLYAQDVESLKIELTQLPLHERIKVPHLPAARADIIPTALITIEALLEHARRDEFTHSFYNLRYGLVAEMLKLKPNL